MRQSQTYRRKQKGNLVMDPNDYSTYRNGVAWRILRRRRGLVSPHDAWQLAAIPAFFYWIFRGPIGFFKKRKVRRKINRKLDKSNTESQTNG